MKRMFLVSLILLGVTLVWADENTNSPWTPSVNLRTVVASKYLAFGSGGTLYDKPVIQSDIFTSFQNGFYVDLWNSTALTGHDSNFGWEQDLGIGWAGPLSTFGICGYASDMTLDIGTTYFDEPGLLTLGAKDVLYSHVKLSKAITKWFAMNGEYENYVTMPKTGYQGGSLFSLGASTSKSFLGHNDDLVTASTALAIVYDNGGFGCDDGFLLRGSAELDWKLTTHVTMILPQVNYYVPVTMQDSRRLDAVVFAGFGYHF